MVPLASLIGATDTAAELADRSGFIPGEALKEQIAAALDADSSDEILFTRLLTDNQGRLLDTTELGRYPSARLAQAIKIRAGTCRYPPAPCPPTAATLIITNPCQRAAHPAETWIRFAADTTAARPSPGTPASETTTASTGPCPPPTTTDAWTNHSPQDKQPEFSGQLTSAPTSQAFCGNPRFSPPWLGSNQRDVITLPRVKKCSPSTPCACVSPKSEFFQPPKE